MSVTKVCPRCGDEYDDTVAFCAKDGTRLVARGETAELIGSIVADRYRIVSSIGEGGMGQVFLAEHVRMKRKSAIKIMRRALVHDLEALQRFTREAENASQIAHPNVAAIFDFGETVDGLVYLAMEYVDGESLAGKMATDFALHPDVAADILGQAADALQAAHDLGILHRDLKPDNIMLGKRPDQTFMVKLVDFGIARTMDSGDQKVTRTGFAIGTPAYMSPEQLAGDVLDARSDQYSLALVAFMALTGKDAFPAESSKESLIARLTSRPQTLQEAKQDVEWPEALQAIFDKALSPEPRDRFPTVSDFAHALSTAISAMTPTQTAELYRRALDVRIANVAMRTPHSDLQALRTPSVPAPALSAPPQRRTEPRDDDRDRRATARDLGALGQTPSTASGAVRLPRDPTTPQAGDSKGNNALVSGARPRSGALTPPGAASVQPSGTVAQNVAAVPPYGGASPPRDGGVPRRSVALPIGLGVLSVIAAGAWYTTQGHGADIVPPVGDSLAAVSGSLVSDSAHRVAVKPSQVATPLLPSPAKAGIVGDSMRARMATDSLKRGEKASADSAKRRAIAIARFPDAAVRAVSGANVDVNGYTARKDELRVTIMSPPVSAWRQARANAWKHTNVRAEYGLPFEVVDPIEVWSAWKSIVDSRKPVYIIEVAPAGTPWPEYKPEQLFDFKRGDVASVRVRRDGVEVELSNAGLIPAVVNDQAHVTAQRKNFGSVVATLGADAFAPHADGSTPKIDVIVIDRSRNSNAVTIALSENMVRRLWADFQAYRDAIALPQSAPAAPAK